MTVTTNVAAKMNAVSKLLKNLKLTYILIKNSTKTHICNAEDSENKFW